MISKVYVDTNIYLDYLGGRKNKDGRDISEPAFQVFNQCLSCNFEIVVSTWVIQELMKHAPNEKTKFLFSFLKRKTRTIKHTKEDVKETKKILKKYDINDKSHFDDALHVVLAKKSKADILVTRNKKNFLPFSNLIQIKFPEEL